MSLRITNEAQYNEWYLKSQNEPEVFWDMIAKNFHWHKTWDTVHSGNFNDLDIEWFQGGKLNITENCLDRHLKERGNQIALIFEPNDPSEKNKTYTYQELFENVCKFANILKEKGIQKGDRVCFYMGMTPELLFGVLACARIGAVHSVIFGGFSDQSLSTRIHDCQAELLVTSDGGYRGSKVVDLKEIADTALHDCPSIKQVLVVKRTGQKIGWELGRDSWLELDKAKSDCPAEIMDAEDPLFILYTSGSTGKPKGLLHTCGGYMVWAGFTMDNVFQMAPNDIFYCTADIGWITGHTYMVYGPLLNGQTQVMFEGIPTWPDAGRFWNLIDKHKVTHFYTAPTAIRSLMGFGLQYVEKYQLNSLKVLGSVGEPINLEAWEWYFEYIGKHKCPIVDTWWQTETGGIMISNLAGVTEAKATFATKPLPGVFPCIVDLNGKELTDPGEGNLCIKKPWPGIARTINGNHQRYGETYFKNYPGLYFTGDGAKRDVNGNYRITGRTDDLIKVAGHLLGTAEIENALDEHPDVVEAAVVGFPHEIKGTGIYAFVILDQSNQDVHENLKHELSTIVAETLGPICRPDKIQIVSGLPKTRSGKIMRRILKKVASGEISDLGDISTLLNPEIVGELIENRA